MKFRSHFSLLLAVLLALLVAGCGGAPTTTSSTNPDPVGFAISGRAGQVRFDLAASDVPLPIALLQSPTTGFNTVPGTGEPFDSINSLQGFSTTGPILINFNCIVDTASIINGNILLIDTVEGTAVPMLFEILELTDAPGNSMVKCYPMIPLDPGEQHLVIVTNRVSSAGQPVTSSQSAGLLKFGGSLVDQNGNSTVGSLTDAQAQALEPIRAAWQPIWAAAEQVTGQNRGQIPLAWTFNTQPLFQTLPVLHTRADAGNPVPVVMAAFQGAAQVNAFFAAIGQSGVPHAAIDEVYIGFFQDTNYISDPVNGPFQGTPTNPTVVSTTQGIPFVGFKGASAAAGTVLFGHGITRSKLDSIAVANGACANGLGVIAIDFVLHGTPGFDQNFGLPSRMLNPTDPTGSGDEFINLANLRMSRDNIRQTCNDLFWLARMIEAGNTNFVGEGQEFRTDNLVYLGQSLGGIIGTDFVATEPEVDLATLNVPGGRLMKLLIDSPTFGPVIIAGLAANGVIQGTSDFESFLWIAQTVVDDADSMNYGAHVLSGDLKGNVVTTALVQEMLGDTVVPNTATTDLVRAMGIRHVLGVQGGQTPAGVPTVNAPTTGSGLFQYQNGGHGFLLDGTANTAPAQTQVLTYFLTGLGFAPPGVPLIIDPFAGPRTDEPTWSYPVDINPDTIRF